MSNNVVEYNTSGGKIQLNVDIVRKYLVSGQGNVTDQEIAMFLQLCKYQKLNPWLKEAYLIKYSDRYPASIVTSKETFLKRATRNEKYRGHEAGWKRNKDEKIIGAWAKVYVKDYQIPIYVEVDLDEYKQDNRMWKEKQKTMIRKVALVQALREAFPEDFGGMQSIEELPTGDVKIDEKPIDITKEVDKKEKSKKAKKKTIDDIGETEVKEEPMVLSKDEADKEQARILEKEKKPDDPGRNELNIKWHVLKKKMFDINYFSDDESYRDWIALEFDGKESSKNLDKLQMALGIGKMAKIFNDYFEKGKK